MPIHDIMAFIHEHEKEAVKLSTRLFDFFRTDNTDPRLALAAMSQLVGAIVEYLTKDVEDPESLKALAEQTLQLFMNAVTLPAQEGMRNKFNQDLHPLEDESEGVAEFVVPYMGTC